MEIHSTDLSEQWQVVDDRMDTVSRWVAAFRNANNDDDRGLVLAMKEVSEIIDTSRELSRTLPRDLLYNKNADEIMRPAENVHTV